MCENGKVISFMNMKGGVCKTTLCINIANTIATVHKEDVLVIDMDPQFNATQYILSILEDDYMKRYKEIKDAEKTIYYLFDDNHRNNKTKSNIEINNVGALFNNNDIEEPYLKDDYIINIKEHFDMIIGDIDLIQLQITQKEGISKRLKRYIEYNKLKKKYKYILVDCPPTFSFYFTSSYTASDTYIIPLKPDYVSSLGLSLLQKAINSIEVDEKPKSCGIVYTLIDTRNKVHEPVMAQIQKNIDNKYIFNNYIYYFADIPRGVEDKKLMIDIHNNNINKTIKLITEEFKVRIERMGKENEPK